MPAFTFDEAVDDEDPLFPPEDPLTFEVPASRAPDGLRHHFTCTGHTYIPDDERYGPNDRPVSYAIEMICGAVIEDQRSACEEVLREAVRDQLLGVEDLGKLIRFLNSEIEKAERARGKRRTKRPTSVPSASTP